MMGRKSIRWRLPLSFLAVASLTVGILGIVLLVTLRGYYQQVELDFLRTKAEEVSSGILPLFDARIPSTAVDSYLENLSFLTQARIRILDARGMIMADTGSPQDFNLALGMLEGRLPQLEGRVEGDLQSFIIIRRGETSEGRLAITPPAPQGESIAEEASDLPTTSIPREDSESDADDGRIVYFPPRERELGDSARTILFEPTISSTPFGYSLGINLIFEESRSNQHYQLAYYTEDGELRGIVEFLEGPAYGRAVLRSVFFGLLLAGGLSIVIAGISGLWISRRLSRPILALSKSSARIADGEYASRVEIDRQDELGTLAKTFNRMAEQVEGTVSTLRRFVSDAAHELNTPLTALRTNLDLAKSEKKAAARRAHLEGALEQSMRLERLTNALLDISRLEGGSEDEVASRLNLSSLVQEVSERYASRAEQAGIDFYLDLPEEPLEMIGVETQLRSLIENLLDNALKFTPQGGEVRVSLQKKDAFASVCVEDTGIGIPEDELPLLFQRFHRARNAYPYPGSGLGLVIVKSIVEGHGGSVEVERKEPGTRFTCRIPKID